MKKAKMLGKKIVACILTVLFSFNTVYAADTTVETDFSENNASNVNVQVVTDDTASQIEAVVSIVDENGNSVEIPVAVEVKTVDSTQNTRSFGNAQEMEYEASAEFYVPLVLEGEDSAINPCADESNLTSPESGNVATGKVKLKYSTKDYPCGSTGILLNYVRVEYTIIDSSATVTSVVTDYWCKGGNGDTTPGFVSDQYGTKVGYGSPHSLSTGFTKYVLDGNITTTMGCESVFNFKMGSTRTWTATVNVDYYSRG